MSRILSRILLAAGACVCLLALAAGMIARLEIGRWENNLAPNGALAPPAFAELAPRVGERAPDFTLPILDDGPLQFGLLLALGRPIVLQIGSWS